MNAAATIADRAYLQHETLPLDVRTAAGSLGARAGRVSRALGQPSLPPVARRAAKDELKAIIREARDLWAKI